jgi:tetratricopeptide (TPR) repeat protein
MPLGEFFADQLGEIRTFLEDPDSVVRIVQVDPEMRPILLRMLAGLDEDDAFPHLLIGHGGRFGDPVQWFTDLQNALEAEIDREAAALAAEGFDVTCRGKDPDQRGPWPFMVRAEQFADSLPDSVGSLAFLIEPEQVDDAAGFVRSIGFLAEKVRCHWLKFIVLDPRLAPRLTGLASHDGVELQTFWCSPQELQTRLDAMLAVHGDSASPEARRVRSMAAAAAFANKNYAKALALQQGLLADARAGGTPADQAMAAYGLGNTLLAAGEAEAAAQALVQACQLCSEHGLNELAPMAYTNLGVSLHRLGDFDQAFAALRVGSTFYRAQGNLPGEAFVCDNLALIYQELDRPAEAEKVLRYVLGRYDSITNPAMADVREAGRADVLAKLERLGAAPEAAAKRAGSEVGSAA